MTLDVAIIGLGQIGMTSDLDLDPTEFIFTHARAFDEHASFEIVAGVESDATQRKQFERAYDRIALASIDEKLGVADPDLVSIAVPTPLHAQVLRQVLSVCRPRAVLCEKPLAYDFEEAREIVALCEASNCDLYVNYIRRADVAVQHIKHRLINRDIAMPVKGVAWYSKGLFNNGSHFLDLLQHWLGEMQTFQVVNKGRLWGEDPEPDVLINFVGGQVQFIAAREEDYSYYAIELISSSGRLRYDLGGKRIVWQAAAASDTAPGYMELDAAEQVIGTNLPRIQWHVADELAKALRGEPTPICTGQEALRTIKHLTSIRNAL